MFTNLEQALQYCSSNGIKMVDFRVIDLYGRWRHLTIPVDRFSEKTMTQGIGFDGSNYGFAPVEKSDMVFFPDLSTGMFDPFAKVPTLSMIGDAYVLGAQPTPF
jgi:glutamine synthetase